MSYFCLYVQLRRGSVAGYTTDESWTYGPKDGVEAFESITFFIRFIYAINFEHLLIHLILNIYCFGQEETITLRHVIYQILRPRMIIYFVISKAT